MKHSHAHLITLLATYTQGGKFHFIFPWAEADLQKYWAHNTHPNPHDGRTSTWLIEQCSGIAQVLDKIHQYYTFPQTSELFTTAFTRKTSNNPLNVTEPEDVHHDLKQQRLFGRHGGIKPANILLFRDHHQNKEPGIVKVTDFGLTRFSTDNCPTFQEAWRYLKHPHTGRRSVLHMVL